ncbi:YhgE/Pip domain-containing protein [Alicyclobacillus fastidiosus]|uniref:YhgE/Pip domain-containing protein n=1 Tax=Alicyclobacillus fastidiosus TaxID=392011 RepID=A0ABY6ZH47_9BACL|nr:YhgE/Pip domain-containing protein [Alicyclobacillus fastidiosus]WAH42151.1 YhgE/Pip domain-containing protein [Alicyclobacillus fastidiosus]GMA63940.1 phage infection protein [Alicyclobacillus fastidiosus]
MNLFRFVGKEFSYNYGSLKRLIPIIAIFFIPILYAGIFLWAFWDPYGHLNRLPVAVVNEDAGSTFAGQRIQAGQQLESQLRKNDDFQWSFVSAEKARAGLEDNQYFMVLTIPKDFSSDAAKAATTVGAPQPKLESVTNDRHNYIAGIIGKNAMEKLQAQTAQQLTKTYTTNLVTGIKQLEVGFQKASGGATTLATGANSLSKSSPKLVSGAKRLATGSDTLAGGIAQAAAGANQVESGTQSVYAGNQQLSVGLGQLAEASGKLSAGAASVNQAAKQLQSGLASEAAGAKQAATGAAGLAQGLSQYLAAHPELANDPLFQALVQASQQVAAGTSQVSSGSDALASGAKTLSSGTNSLDQGLGAFAPKLQQAATGAAALVKQEPTLVQGSRQVATGLAQLESGASQLQTGAGSLMSGVNQYADGAKQVATGSSQLASQLRSASAKMPVIHSGQVVSATSNPVGLSQSQAGDIPNYGTGFAPYFLSLGLFVGALLMSIIISFRDPAEKPSSSFAWFLSKTLLVGSVAVAQALIADTILLSALGLHVGDVTHFVLFSLLTSLTFVSIIQFFVTTLANPGRFLSVIVLILQLTSSSGTYPVVLSPPFFQHLSRYLPMTYTVDGFRYLVGGGKVSFMHSDIWHLFVYWGVFVGLTLVYFLVRGHFVLKDAKPQAPSGMHSVEA